MEWSWPKCIGHEKRLTTTIFANGFGQIAGVEEHLSAASM
jgi:hypothetical protein